MYIPGGAVAIAQDKFAASRGMPELYRSLLSSHKACLERALAFVICMRAPRDAGVSTPCTLGAWDVAAAYQP